MLNLFQHLHSPCNVAQSHTGTLATNGVKSVQMLSGRVMLNLFQHLDSPFNVAQSHTGTLTVSSERIVQMLKQVQHDGLPINMTDVPDYVTQLNTDTLAISGVKSVQMLKQAAKLPVSMTYLVGRQYSGLGGL